MMLDMELKEQRREGYYEGYKSGYKAGYKAGYKSSYKAGYKAGYNKGRNDEHIKIITENVRNLAEGMGLTHDEAFDKLKVSPEDRVVIIEWLKL